MSTDPSAKLFYGYKQPDADKKAHQKIDYATAEAGEDDTPWSATHTKRSHGCIGVIHGYDEHLGFFLAVEASLHEAEWDEVVTLSTRALEIQPEWHAQLQQAAKAFHLDVSGMVPRWYLVCLYF
jgi:hypothetical protein